MLIYSIENEHIQLIFSCLDMFQNAQISYEFHSIKDYFTCPKISLHKIEFFIEKFNVKIKLCTSWDSVYLLHTFVF